MANKEAIEAAAGYKLNDQNMIVSPGKFEGEARYVPYFWDLYMQGGASEDDGEHLYFDVEPEDVEAFPELKGRKRVILWTSDSGFVYECDEVLHEFGL